jgi:uncharacterized cofD-like protein
MYTDREPDILIIGGGSGTAAIYPEIARRTEHATAVVGIFDSGGSTGRLREAFGIPAVGDLRNVMMAASRNPAVREMRSHRFTSKDGFRGHSVGNLVVAACVMEHGVKEGVRLAGLFLQVPGRVLPVALEGAELELEDGAGNVIRGEQEIDVYHPVTAEPRVSLVPDVPINGEVAEAIARADLIVIPGGSVYTSLLAALRVRGVAQALREARAPKVLLANLATEQHQTDGWHVIHFVEALQRQDIYPDIVLYNTQQPTPEMLANYAQAGEKPVDCRPELFDRMPMVRFKGAPLLSREAISLNPNDPVKRGLMRHDPVAVANELWQIFAETPASITDNLA